MRVRLVQQIQGTRDGQQWPEPGTEVDLPDAEARALISGGAAVEPGEVSPTVLVPPKGVHTPGRVAMPADATSPLVAAPADAVSDPAAARKAYEDAQAGNFTAEGPPGVAHQRATGEAYTSEELDKVGEREQVTREAFAEAAPKVGDTARTTSTGKTTDKK